MNQPGTRGLGRSLGGTALGDSGGVSLNLRNVWGGAALEVLVTISSCGNRCDDRLYLALETAGTWHLVSYDFGGFWPGRTAWTVRLFRGRSEFVSSDTRFFCYFASCAGSAVPPQVFAIDRSGRSFVDVTRTRPDIVRVDAAHQWREYLSARHREQESDYAIGTLAAWCADEYLLRRGAHCDQVLERERIGGYLSKIPRLSGQGFIQKLHHELTIWGYASR